MPVTFGTVEVIPQAAPASAPDPSGEAGAASSSSSSTPTPPSARDPRELAAALRWLADREARVRAH